jgi:hypothetical protein
MSIGDNFVTRVSAKRAQQVGVYVAPGIISQVADKHEASKHGVHLLESFFPASESVGSTQFGFQVQHFATPDP